MNGGILVADRNRSDRATIFIDGEPYRGEDYDATEPADYGGEGWHVANHGKRNLLLIGGGEPKVIIGSINLKSHLDRILARVRDGSIEAGEITIKLEG